MAEVTPTDELTGMPLPIMPRDDEVLLLLRYPRLNEIRKSDGGQYADLNHLYHPRPAPELASDDGLAVRSSRVQLVMRRVHNEYHAAFAGPPLPQTAADRLRAVVFGVAGYVPRQGIDLDGLSPRVVTMSDAQVERLRTSGEIRPQHTVNIQKFLRKIILENPQVGHIPKELMDEFLALPVSGRHEARHQQLANRLLSLVIEPATEPLDDVYRLARQEYAGRSRTESGPQHVVRNILLGQGQRRGQNLRKIGSVLFDALSERRELAMSA